MVVVTNYKTITLDKAKRAVAAYNNGTYFRCRKNVDIDLKGRDLFQHGLGFTRDQMLEQLEFIGLDYGGVRAHRKALTLAPAIATDILADRANYANALTSTAPILVQLPSRNIIDVLFRPFKKRLLAKGRTWNNWLVWATKFWHFPNPGAFPIEDGRADEFFLIGSAKDPVDKYLAFADRFRDFVLSHRSWLPALRQADCGTQCSDNKLWDKIWYGLGELEPKKRKKEVEKPTEITANPS
jgi:hypothetical protein